jgi:hypothetical protein
VQLHKVGSLVGITCLLVLSSVVLPVSPAAACSCAGPASADDYLRQADVAFLGDVIAARIADPDSVIQGEARLASPEMIYTIDVQEVYKGAVTERQEVSSSLESDSCGAGLEINHRYVVYARHGIPGYTAQGILHTGLCDGTYEPDGVRSFPLEGANAPAPGGDPPHGIPPGDVREGPSQPVGLAALAGVMLVSAALAAAMIGIARKT